MSQKTIVTIQFPVPADENAASDYMGCYEKISILFPGCPVFAPMNGKRELVSIEILSSDKLERNYYRRIRYNVNKILGVFFKPNQIRIKTIRP
jgi:hypothetical protein